MTVKGTNFQFFCPRQTCFPWVRGCQKRELHSMQMVFIVNMENISVVDRCRKNVPNKMGASSQSQQFSVPPGNDSYPAHPLLDMLRIENNYNPKESDLNAKNARYFIIKSFGEDDIHRSIKYSIWCSTEFGNKRLDVAFREREGKGPVYLFFSVNGSGHFCGMAQMVSPVDYNASSGVWAQDSWRGQFKVKWIYVKDVPNALLRHILLENNDNKPVTHSRDTQEVPPEKGKMMLTIIHNYHHTTSIFDDFLHNEKRQEDDEQRKAQQSLVAQGRTEH